MYMLGKKNKKVVVEIVRDTKTGYLMGLIRIKIESFLSKDRTKTLEDSYSISSRLNDTENFRKGGVIEFSFLGRERWVESMCSYTLKSKAALFPLRPAIKIHVEEII